MLGLITAESLRANASENARRQVFSDFPMGKAPLTGLLSLMDDAEEIIDPSFGWWEKSYKSTRDKTVATVAGSGPFATNDAGGVAAADAVVAQDGIVYLQLVDASRFRVRDILMITNLVGTDSTTLLQPQFYVTGVRTDTNVVTCKSNDATLAALGAKNSGSVLNNGLYVTVIGSASAEGERSRSDGYTDDPFEVLNYSQIVRTTLPIFTGTAVKMGQRFDSTGRYRTAAKDTVLRHMEMLEKAFLFGRRRIQTTTNADGDSVPMRFLGGAQYWLEQWDKGNTNNGGDFNYRPGGTDLSSADWTVNEEKRVIRNIGTITSSLWMELIRRIFSSQSDSSFEKLVFCGDKTLAAVNEWVKSQSLATRMLNPKEESYGMQIKEVETIHGNLLFKTHPLFKEDPALQNSFFVLDMGDLLYHPMMGRDTDLLKNRQSRDVDSRKDEWLTECTLEFRMPKRHMMVTGLTGILS